MNKRTEYNVNMVKTNKTFLKTFLISLLVLSLVFCTIYFTASYLTTKDYLNNIFVTGNTDITITETFDNLEKVKSDVAIQNVGNVPVYVRSNVLIYWEDSDGKVLTDIPEEGVDYTLIGSDSDNWTIGSDDYYYYKNPVNYTSGQNETDYLIRECKQIKTYSDGRVLVVDILSQSIQASPVSAVEEAWKVTVSDSGNLTPPSVS